MDSYRAGVRERPFRATTPAKAGSLASVTTTER